MSNTILISELEPEIVVYYGDGKRIDRETCSPWISVEARDGEYWIIKD